MCRSGPEGKFRISLLAYRICLAISVLRFVGRAVPIPIATEVGAKTRSVPSESDSLRMIRPQIKVAISDHKLKTGRDDGSID